MAQNTAVSWLHQQLVDRQNGKGDSRSLDEIFEQAKAMEKEQIMNTWYECKISIIDKQPKDAGQYYNETYKKE